MADLSEAPLPAWKRYSSHIAAILMAIVYFASGGYKMLMPLDAAERLTQVLIPGNLSVALAVVLAITEVFTAIMLLIPRFRRFGAMISLAMLAAFCIYITMHFEQLRGADCGCFPLIKRAVGPVFYISNGVMIVLSFIAGWWSSRATSWFLPSPLRTSVAVFALLTAVTLGSVGLASARESGLEAPPTVLVGEQRVTLADEPTFIYMYDPECSHCLQSAKMMAGWDWGKTRLIAVPTVNPQWGQFLLDESGFKARLATDPEDLKSLREIFQFANPPYGVALRRGRARVTVRYAEFEPELENKLRSEGFLADK
jgi:uncharacterized membrane protein YphA (DoxX/SURF4 family)